MDASHVIPPSVVALVGNPSRDGDQKFEHGFGLQSISITQIIVNLGFVRPFLILPRSDVARAGHSRNPQPAPAG